jgi:hypothetical protein
VSPTDRQGHIIWRSAPPSPGQKAAWDCLWRWLLCPETEQPQDHGGPGADTVAAVTSGSHRLSERNNDNRFDPYSK